MAGTDHTSSRPLSPHLQVWRWHATMAASIFHRATGAALYGGMFLLSAWIIAIASGPEAYAVAEQAIFSLIGQLILFGFTLAIMYHLANGLRHLIWDGPGVGFSPAVASTISVFNFAFAILAAAGIWSAAYFIPA